MKFTRIVVVIAGVLFAAQATAQTVQSAQPQVAPSAQPQATVQNQAVVTVTPAPVVESNVPSAQPAAPASSSATDLKVDAIKKVREDVEQKNDTKMVEKLEKTRLDEEKNLSQKIDSTNLKDQQSQQATQPAQPVQPEVKIEKVEVIQPTPAVAPVAQQKPEEKKEEKKERKWYAGVGAGNVIYNGNVFTKSDIGLMIGTMVDSHMAVEGSVTYTSLALNNYWNGGGAANLLFGSMDQYDVGGAVKYYVLDNQRFRPYVGAGADYIFRQYGNAIYGSYNDYANSQSTNSFNASLLTGIDVRLTERFSIGAEFKYSLPIFYEDNGIVTSSYWESWAKPLEQTSFTSWLIDLKFNF